MFYDIVFFLSPEAVAAGAKVSLISGKYVITKAQATTIQAVNGGRPPIDQSAQVMTLEEELAACQAALATCLAGGPPPPPLAQTIDSFIVSPNPVTAGQPVTLTWATSNASAVTLDGVLVVPSGAMIATPVADKTFTLVASGSVPAITATIDILVQAAIPPGAKIPLLAGDMVHIRLNWMADFMDPAKAAPRGVPWRMPEFVAPMNGVRGARYRVWDTYFREMGLYSLWPAFDATGLSAPWTPQIGDKFDLIVKDLLAHPSIPGPRGINRISSYGVFVGHPTFLPDGVTPIPRAPLWMDFQHDGKVFLKYADGHVDGAGQIPRVQYLHDACVEETNRLSIVIAELGTPNSAGVFSGSSIKIADRTPGHGTATSPEDATKYVVTDYITGGVYFSGCTTDNPSDYGLPIGTPSNRYTVDFGTGIVRKNLAVWKTIPNAFGCCYDGVDSVLIVTSVVEVFRINCITGAVGPNLFAAVSGGNFGIGIGFVTISVDVNGTFDRAGNIAVSRSHGPGNLDVWVWDGTIAKLVQSKYGGGLGYKKVGDLKYQQEWAGHYLWDWQYHPDQGRVLTGGFTSPMHEIVGYVNANEVPAEEAEPDAMNNGYVLGYLAQQVINKGGSKLSPFDKPSLNCQQTREGGSPFINCSSDEIAEMPFDAAYDFLRQGLNGAFRRDDLSLLEVYAWMVAMYQNSQTYLLRGAVLMFELKMWWIGRFGSLSIPSIQSIGNYTPEFTQDLVARNVGGVWKVVVRSGPYDTTTAPPAGAVIVADEGIPKQVTLPATLAPGQHALTAKATGWKSMAVAMKV